jgi:hypothetical protein
MKAKLIRRDNGEFYLIDENNKITSHHHLSKQNCDEIFGAFDVEKLAEEEYPTFNLELNLTTSFNTLAQAPFINGFNKAMELNKDKVFTLEDMNRAIELAREFNFSETNIIQSLQPPTEIEVEIEMETCSMNPLDLDCDEIIERIKLDSDDCLILKKI